MTRQTELTPLIRSVKHPETLPSLIKRLNPVVFVAEVRERRM